jgi:hypothetical protein
MTGIRKFSLRIQAAKPGFSTQRANRNPPWLVLACRHGLWQGLADDGSNECSNSNR